MVSPCMVRWRADCWLSALIRRAGRCLAQRQWCVLELSFPGRPGRFLELGLFAPGVVPVCLMMTVNVIASSAGGRNRLTDGCYVGATCVDGLPLYRSWESRLSAEWLSALDPESDHRLAQLAYFIFYIFSVFLYSDVCWSCLPLSSRSVPTQERILQFPLEAGVSYKRIWLPGFFHSPTSYKAKNYCESPWIWDSGESVVFRMF